MAENLYKEILDHTPNHYELLGLKLFESNAKTIKKAGMDQTRKIKEWALHPDLNTATEVQKLRRLVDTAIMVLEDKQKKKKYDRELAKDLGVSRRKKRTSSNTRSKKKPASGTQEKTSPPAIPSQKKPSLTIYQPITCPECNTVNEPGIKDCTGCDKHLLHPCSNCQRETPIDKQHCFYCKTITANSTGQKIKKQKLKDKIPQEKPTPEEKEIPKISNKTTIKIAASLVISLIVFLFLFFLGKAIYSVIRSYEENKEINTRREVAEKLGIPLDVKKPTVPFSELEKLANDPSSKIFKSWEQQIPPFDKEATEQEICKELGISLTMKKEPELTLPQVEEKAQKLIAKNIKIAIKQKTTVFDEFSVRNAIIKEFGLEKPIKEPEKTIETLKKELLRESGKKAAKKYPSSLLSKQEKAIKEKYTPYKEGEKVTVTERNGLRYTGIFRGTNGSHLKIGNRTLRLKDLSKSQQTKCNKSYAERKKAYETKRVKNAFNQKRKEYEKKYFDNKIEKCLYENGHIQINDEWTTTAKLIQKKLKEAATAHQEAQQEIINNLELSIPMSFDHDKFIKKHGYIKLNDQWYTEEQAFGHLLKEKIAAYDEAKKQKLEQLKNQFFRKNGYIQTDEVWQATSDLLEKETQKALASKKKQPETEITITKIPEKSPELQKSDPTPPQTDDTIETAETSPEEPHKTLKAPTSPKNIANSKLGEKPEVNFSSIFNSPNDIAFVEKYTKILTKSQYAPNSPKTKIPIILQAVDIVHLPNKEDFTSGKTSITKDFAYKTGQNLILLDLGVFMAVWRGAEKNGFNVSSWFFVSPKESFSDILAELDNDIRYVFLVRSSPRGTARLGTKGMQTLLGRVYLFDRKKNTILDVFKINCFVVFDGKHIVNDAVPLKTLAPLIEKSVYEKIDPWFAKLKRK